MTSIHRFNDFMAEKKYWWTQEKIDYMRDAYEYTRFQNTLADYVARYIEPTDTICDAGCGLGYVSMELARHCASVTAVDVSQDVLDVLDSKIGRTDKTGYSYPSNVKTLKTDISSLPEGMSFDWIIFCFFGQMPEIVDVMKRYAKKGVILIHKNWKNHRLSSREIPLERLRYTSDIDYLEENNITYETESFDIDLGQPLKDKEQALRFFELYDRNENTDRFDERVRIERLSKLVPIDSPDYEYYLPMISRVGIIIIEKS
ncbi:MAG: class I SAM-dependent methyltransferase [Bacillota bacterium]|nr:class I SAM-dependent methyltransferase [Bacillota bacterium]